MSNPVPSNMVSVLVLPDANGGFNAKVTFRDGGTGQAHCETPEEALVSATNLAVLDRKFLEENTSHIIALAEGLSPGALRHVSDHYYRLADEARSRQNALPVSNAN